MSEIGDKLKDQFLRKLIPTIIIRQGGIYRVVDDPQNPVVKFPEDNLPLKHPRGKRTFHKQRYVLVFQSNELNNKNEFPHVQVIPLSSKGRDTELTVEIPDEFLSDGIPGPSIALIHLCQPMLKIFLEKEVGFVLPSHDISTTIRSIYLRIIGLM
ncbi:type II toxin-antitoxin system PemK/MazF family toxin [candidate division KSB1 bacterium]|nr:type II toxin-antitoxin system PemK/MazF family toxin [candidate division KSB1 bacterium]